jgi:hypothetical protein
MTTIDLYRQRKEEAEARELAESLARIRFHHEPIAAMSEHREPPPRPAPKPAKPVKRVGHFGAFAAEDYRAGRDDD